MTWRKRSRNPPHNAHHFRIAKVLYRWHPLFNQTMTVRRSTGQNPPHLLCELPDGSLTVIPKWMTEVEVCSALSLGKPEVSLSALRRLRELADAVAGGRDPDGSKCKTVAES